MNKQLQLNALNELLWAVIAVIITTIVLLPLMGTFRPAYLAYNALLILVAVIYFRYVMNGSKIAYLQHNWVIYGLTLFNLAFLAYFIVRLQEFLYEIDNYVLTFFIIDNIPLDGDQIAKNFRYFKREFLFFGISAALLTIAFELRLIKLLWKTLRK